MKGKPYIIAKLTIGKDSLLQFVWPNLDIYNFLDKEINNGDMVEVQCKIEKYKNDLNMKIENISVIYIERPEEA